MSSLLVSNVPNAIIRESMLPIQRVDVRAEGENVVLTIGNSEIRMQYEDALKISQFIRVRAKEAKRKCGDVSRHWSALAVLDGLKG